MAPASRVVLSALWSMAVPQLLPWSRGRRLGATLNLSILVLGRVMSGLLQVPEAGGGSPVSILPGVWASARGYGVRRCGGCASRDS